MKTLIVYASRYGTTRECARTIAGKIRGGADLVDLRRDRIPAFDDYDSVVIGGPIYAGKMTGAIGRFCERHREALLERAVALFICCLYEGETALAELEEAFPSWLNTHALARRAAGGAITFGRLSRIDRYLARKVAGITSDIRTVKDEELAAVAVAIERYRTSSTRSPKTSGR